MKKNSARLPVAMADQARPRQQREVQSLTHYTIAKYVAFAGLGAGALLIFGPMAAPTIGGWLSSMGLISGVRPNGWPGVLIWLFGTFIPGSIAVCVGLVALTIAVVLRVRARVLSRGLPMVSRKALVRRPSSRLSEGIVDHIERVPVDYELAVNQWEHYVALLQRYGWETTEVAPADDCPDSVFVEDTMVVYKKQR